MFKKIYSCLFCLILLASCSVDNALEENLPSIGNNDEVVFNFSVDVPLASSIISKSGSALTEDGEELGVSGLYLYTFDAAGGFIEKVEPNVVSSNGDVTTYKATVKKTVRKIHFLSNYVGAELYDATDDIGATDERFYALTTEQYVFWNVQTFATGDALAQIEDDIELYRNWAKVSVSVQGKAKDKLSNVEFAIYNQSNFATMAARTDGVVNVPEDNTYTPAVAPVFAKVVNEESLYPFENYADLTKNGGHQTYIIVKATYNGGISYYKLDLSNDREDGIKVVWDVIRNKWYQIIIEDVQREGVSTWEAAIDPENLPNNNISASSEIDAYPKISYKDDEQKLETLEVEKTTYIMTQSGAEFKSWAIYTYDNSLANDEIDTIDENVSDIFTGQISEGISGGKFTMNATMTDIGETPKSGYFYVQAGSLQRKISIILRKPYQFINYRVSPNSVNESNKENEITVHFEFPLTGVDKVDESIFPLPCYIYSDVLYTVQEGIEIEVLEGGGYRYVYLAKTPEGIGGHDVVFKLNKTEAVVQTENILLSANYFRDETLDLTINIPEKEVSSEQSVTSGQGSIRYGELFTSGSSNSLSQVSSGASISSSHDKVSITVGNNGVYTVKIKAGAKYNDLVTFTYRRNSTNYYCTISIQQILARENIYLTKKGSNE